MRRPLAGVAVVALALALAGAVACFSPQVPACAFSCSRGKTCPAAWICGDDGLCHNPGSHGRCDLDPITDGGADRGDGGDGAADWGDGGDDR